MFDYDLFVIGAGSGGVRCSRLSAAMGARVAVAEEQWLGGTCVNVGCVPKKLFAYGAHFADLFEDAKGFGWSLEGTGFDWPTLRDNKTKEIHRLNEVYTKLLEEAGVDLINGRATIVDANTVEVNSRRYRCKRILIATGSWPFIPEIPGREHVITSNEVFYLEQLPKRLLIVGGGYIAVEFASILARFGVQVTLSYRRDLFLRGFDSDVRIAVKDEMLKNENLTLEFNSIVEGISKQKDNLEVRFAGGQKQKFDQVLYATGRKANTQGLNLEQLGVSLKPSGDIEVDNNFQTAVPSLYALGDVIGTMQLTPVALAQGIQLAAHLNQGKAVSMDYTNIPTAVFCTPNIGTVGLTEEQARAEFDQIKVFKSHFKPMRHTLAMRDEKVFIKLLVDATTDKVIGCHMVGDEAGEVIQGLAVAIKAGATKADFDNTLGIHPTTAEEWVTLREPVND